MQEVPPSPVLEALYMEAGTRRRTADAKEAEVLAAEAACRTARKLTDHSALLVDTRLQRDVECVFQRHRLPGTGLLTKGQLRASLQNLGMLGSKPAAFASTAERAAAVQSNVLHPNSAQRQSKVLDSLWQICATNQPTEALSLNSQAAEATSAAYANLHRDADSRVALEQQDEADSSDVLLDESIDAWQLFIRTASEPEASQIESRPWQLQSTTSDGAYSEDTWGKPSPGRKGRRASATARNQARHNNHEMHGVSFQQLLSFVQLVQHQTSSLSPAAAPMPAFKHLAPHQCAELIRLARTCSDNKQANMAYVSIGNRKQMQQGTAGPLRKTAPQASAVQPAKLMTSYRSDEQQSHGTAHKSWRPQGPAGRRQAALLASTAVRFSRRNHKQQQGQSVQCNADQGVASPRPRPRPLAGELAKTQPFARSASTAAEVVKRRQALAELEMAPCTFHPALDPHSRVLVTAMADSYKAPHRTAFPCSHAPPADLMRLSSGASANDSGQDFQATSEALPKTLLPAEANRGPLALTSWHIQEQQAFDACTFAPKLNDTSRVKSIVAQRWQRPWLSSQQPANPQDQPSALHMHTAATDIAAAADSAGTRNVSAAPLDQQIDAAKVHNAADGPGPSASKQQLQDSLPCVLAQHTGTSKRCKWAADAGVQARQGRQFSNSYAAAAQRAREHCRAIGPLNPSAERQLQQHQPLQSRSTSSDEGQLEADIADCDKQLAQHKQLRLSQPACLDKQALLGQKATTDDALSVQSVTGQEDLQTLQSQLRIGLEALLPDGSAITLQVGQAQRLRHLTKLFAAMLELSAPTAANHTPAVLGGV